MIKDNEFLQRDVHICSLGATASGWRAVFRTSDKKNQWEEHVQCWCIYRERCTVKDRRTWLVVRREGWSSRAVGGIIAKEFGGVLAENEDNFCGYRSPEETIEDFWKREA